MFKNSLYISLVLIVGTSCASSFKSISSYQGRTENIDEVMKVGYVDDIYTTSLNTRYAKYEELNGYRTIAIEIENTSSLPMVIDSEKFKIYAGKNECVIAETDYYLKKVRQHAGLYMLHTLWGPWGKSTTEDTYSGKETSYFFLPIGLIVGIINTVKASKANSKHAKYINESQVFDKVIEPNEKLEGVIALKTNYFGVLTFKYSD